MAFARLRSSQPEVRPAEVTQMQMRNELKVRDMRHQLEMTQEEFAQELGITVSTVNRWENGHSNPSKLARATLERMASRHGVVVSAPAAHRPARFPPAD